MRIVLPLLLLLPACATIKKPFLYSAEKDGKQITLLGTIHTSVLANDLPGVVTDEMYASKTAFFETDFHRFQAVLDARGDKEMQKREIRRLYYRRKGNRKHEAEPKLSERLPKDMWEQVVKRLPQYTPAQLDELNPQGAAGALRERKYADISQFEAFRLNPANSMDLWLHTWAIEKGVAVKRLDRNDDVCRSEFDAAAVDAIRKLLAGSPDERNFDDMRDLTEAYRNGDENEVRAAIEKIPDAYEGDCLIGDRNREWAEKLVAFAKPGEKVFVAVGALHLLTVKHLSLLKLLEAQGYTVRRITP